MKAPIQVASPPPKPLLVYDGDCQFCGFWARRWRRWSDGRIEILPSQDARVAERYPEVPREQFESAVHLIDMDGSVYSAAEAVFRALGRNPQKQWWVDWYLRRPMFARISEWFYRLISRNRKFLSYVMRLFIREPLSKAG